MLMGEKLNIVRIVPQHSIILTVEYGTLSIKSEINAYVLFAPSCIGEDGAAFVSAIDPSRGSFRGATKLLSLRTTQINLFDTLRMNVNRVRVLRKGH